VRVTFRSAQALELRVARDRHRGGAAKGRVCRDQLALHNQPSIRARIEHYYIEQPHVSSGPSVGKSRYVTTRRFHLGVAYSLS